MIIQLENQTCHKSMAKDMFRNIDAKEDALEYLTTLPATADHQMLS